MNMIWVMSRFLSGFPHRLYNNDFFTENVLMYFVKEDADVDYISLDLHLIKSTLVSELKFSFNTLL